VALITTSNAATRLGISVRRVTQLIDSGRLKATRFGKSWAIDERHLTAVVDRPPAGRPRKRAASR
jgi:excisionase family DNA binding protein